MIKMKLLFKVLPLLTLLSVFSSDLFADDALPGIEDCWPPPCVPVTDHIGWLIAAMVIFGIYKSIQYSRKSVNA